MKRLLIVANEPSPYMTDLHNALAERPGWSVKVYYPVRRDAGPQGGHDYRLFPERRYDFVLNRSRGFAGQLRGCWETSRLIWGRPDAVVVNGYSSLVHVGALLLCFVARVPFLFFGDYFNVTPPKNWAARWARRALRFLVFQKSAAVLMCGKTGIRSAVESGCPAEKVLDFPYAVSEARLWDLAQQFEKEQGKAARQHWPPGRLRVLFSGRMIQRKGLDTLLAALQNLKKQGFPFFLLAEGSGPMHRHYQDEAARLGLSGDCVFLGFCQMDRHAWLLSQADLVVVPSLSDPWGLVVPEAMLMGKAVVASDVVGSAVHHVQHGENGLVFKAGDVTGLGESVARLLQDSAFGARLGRAGQATAQAYSPQRNAAVLFDFLEKRTLC
jgi:glycosyltransferase involved in cell wall biosynthesis